MLAEREREREMSAEEIADLNIQRCKINKTVIFDDTT